MPDPKTLVLTLFLTGCASTPPTRVDPPVVEPPVEPTGPAEKSPLLPVELPVVPPEMLADALGRVEHAMEHAHGVLQTRKSFTIGAAAVNVGQIGWSSTHVMFALNDEVVGTIDRNGPCGSDTLRVPWRSVPVGRQAIVTTIESSPVWWRVGDGHIRVGATELIGVASDARGSDECALWGVIVDGPARADAEVNSPGSSGVTDGLTVDIFGTEQTLVVASTGVLLGELDGVRLTPTFEATCAHVRWASDLLGTRTLRARFSNGPQVDDCAEGDVREEFVHAVGPDGELSRTERVRHEATGLEREDRVIRTIGAARLIWEARSTTSSTVEDDCETQVQQTTAKWTVKHPTQPEHSAEARRVRTQSTCTKPSF